MTGGEANVRKGMERSQLWNPPLSQLEGACPRDPAFLAPSANSTPPEREHPIPKHPQTRQVSQDCRACRTRTRLLRAAIWVVGEKSQILLMLKLFDSVPSRTE